jgi:hypothetical protein
MVRPRAGAAVLARGRGVLLLEGPEDRSLLVRRNADAGVAHGKAQPYLPLGCGVAGGFHAHDHFPFVGELDRVAHQVEQDLPQPSRVPDERVGHLRLHVGDQLQPFLVGPHGQGTERVTHCGPQ